MQKLIVIPQRGDTREFMINKHLVNLNPHWGRKQKDYISSSAYFQPGIFLAGPLFVPILNIVQFYIWKFKFLTLVPLHI